MVTLVSTGLVGLAHYVGFTSTSTYSDGYKWLGLGISTSSEAAGNTALGSEITTQAGLNRSTCTHTYETNTAVWSHIFTSTTNVTVTEAAIFDSSSGTGGHMLMRHLFTSGKALANAETLTITLKLIQSSTT